MTGISGTKQPWLLLEELCAFVATEGWERDVVGCEAWERWIAEATGIVHGGWHGAGRDEWRGTFSTWAAARFLRSRDAAAMLEDVIAKDFFDWIEISISREPCGPRAGWWTIECTGRPFSDEPEWLGQIQGPTEPVARTLAALQAGHCLGLWPVA